MTDLPLLLAGPIVRRFTDRMLTLWLVTSQRVEFSPAVQTDQQQLILRSEAEMIQIGKHAYTYLLNISFDSPIKQGDIIEYSLQLRNGQQTLLLPEQSPELLYPDEKRFNLCYQPHLKSVLHGSCRKPHHPGTDALTIADDKLSQIEVSERPSLLIMSGDQIYADDVSGPVLNAIHQLISALGIADEQLPSPTIPNSTALYNSPNCYYAREQLLPSDKPSGAALQRMFRGVRKPIFTSDSAHNHLITFAEVYCMYLLVWSPTLWRSVDLSAPATLNEEKAELYQKELQVIEEFSSKLTNVQRLLAHIPSYMMFDDHDVTDDWNLTRGWEETAYGNPFAKQMLGNALIAYWLCQGWGNDPDRFEAEFVSEARDAVAMLSPEKHRAFIDKILDFSHWHYTVPTSPKVIMLDTRTHRWRSESDTNKPSGLMDWEALSELQNELIDEHSVLLVSPAPIFGVKFIEMIQRVFTYFGKPLLVDAENWMAHPGSANVILNIFQHPKTPENFIVLSGDVHYSFAYDIRLRSRSSSPDIWQITCSGLKNEFPEKLIRWFDRLNTAFYGYKSPLNWLTKRRRMKIRSRRTRSNLNQRLFLSNGIGYLELSLSGRPEKIAVWTDKGEEMFIRKRD